MPDRIQTIGKSLIQHGKENDRVYLMKLDPSDLPDIIGRIDNLVREHAYTKVFAKVPRDAAEDFLASGYEIEAFIPRFYRGEKDALLLGFYPSEERRKDPAEFQKLIEIIQTSLGKREKSKHDGECSWSRQDFPPLSRSWLRSRFFSAPRR
ncbi:hypothetical protein HQ520_06365, partial [bacterium]|nr:hypothetical protein [bacterium]